MQPPGHGIRRGEPPCLRLCKLVPPLASAVASSVPAEAPLVLLGHGLGGLVAYEVRGRECVCVCVRERKGEMGFTFMISRVNGGPHAILDEQRALPLLRGGGTCRQEAVQDRNGSWTPSVQTTPS